MKKDTIIPAIRSAVRELCKQTELLYRQVPAVSSSLHWHALIEVDSYKVLNSQQLSALLHINKVTTTRLVTQLVGKGLFQVTSDLRDGRHKLLSLTKNGTALVHKIYAATDRQIETALATTSESAQNQVAQGLCDYTKALKRAQLIKECVFRKLAEHEMPMISHFVRLMRAESGYPDDKICPLFTAYNQNKRSFFTIIRNKKIMGAAGYGAMTNDADACILWSIYFSYYIRGVGFGAELIHKVFEDAKAQGFKRCYAEISDNNEELTLFYKKAGFEPAKKPKTMSMPSQGIWYVKEL